MKRMKIGLIVGAVLATVGIGGCVSTPPSPIGFNYQVDNGQANRIVQVFDLSGNTVVQIRNVDAKTTRFYDTHHVEIPYKIIGENVVFNGLQTSFTVSSQRAASRVVRTAPVPGAGASVNQAQVGPVAAAAAAPVGVAAGQQVVDEKVLAEIMRMKKELAELKKMLAAAEAPSASAPATLAQSPPVPAAPQAEVVRVSFANNSQSFAPPREVGAYLVEMSRSAKTVEVRGFTDSASASATSQALARGRADAAKRFLVRHGVDASKVRVEYEPAGKFATENLTTEGKATNRRVEIRAS